MKQRRSRYFTDSELDPAWNRWQKGESLNSIARLLGTSHSAVAGVFSKTGGIRPPPRRRSRMALTDMNRQPPLAKADYRLHDLWSF